MVKIWSDILKVIQVRSKDKYRCLGYVISEGCEAAGWILFSPLWKTPQEKDSTKTTERSHRSMQKLVRLIAITFARNTILWTEVFNWTSHRPLLNFQVELGRFGSAVGTGQYLFLSFIFVMNWLNFWDLDQVWHIPTCRPNTVPLSQSSAFPHKRCWIYSCTTMPLLWIFVSH